jgi:hypothetical protein
VLLRKVKCSLCFFYSSHSRSIREGHRLRKVGKTVLRKVQGLKREDVPGNWRKVHNDVKDKVRPITDWEAPEGE